LLDSISVKTNKVLYQSDNAEVNTLT
jgi:hypothetical protein